jgi:hypothetical protein
MPTSSRLLRVAAFLVSLAALVSGQKPGPAPTGRGFVEVFGGRGTEFASAVAATSDGGAFVAGWTDSSGAGGEDAWVARVDRRGRRLWEQALGGPQNDEAFACVATPDGGCLLAGTTLSFGAGLSDAWAVKLDALGGIEWQKAYGDADEDRFNAAGLSAAGYYLAGTVTTKDTFQDAWVLELDLAGNVLWQETFPGDGGFDSPTSLARTADGLALVVTTNSSLGGQPFSGFFRPWFVRLDAAGAPLVQRTYDFSSGDYWSHVSALSDGTFAVTGEILSAAFFRGDAWAVQLDADGDVLWDRRFGDNFGNLNFDGGRAIRQTSDGGFFVFASTSTGSDPLWLIRLDRRGEMLWNRTLAPGFFGEASGLDLAPNGELLLGATLFAGGPGDAALVRLSPGGRGLACEFSSPGQPNVWSSPLTIEDAALAPAPAAYGSTDTAATVTPLATEAYLCPPGS